MYDVWYKQKNFGSDGFDVFKIFNHVSFGGWKWNPAVKSNRPKPTRKRCLFGGTSLSRVESGDLLWPVLLVSNTVFDQIMSSVNHSGRPEKCYKSPLFVHSNDFHLQIWKSVLLQKKINFPKLIWILMDSQTELLPKL